MRAYYISWWTHLFKSSCKGHRFSHIVQPRHSPISHSKAQRKKRRKQPLTHPPPPKKRHIFIPFIIKKTNNKKNDFFYSNKNKHVFVKYIKNSSSFYLTLLGKSRSIGVRYTLGRFSSLSLLLFIGKWIGANQMRIFTRPVSWCESWLYYIDSSY